MPRRGLVLRSLVVLLMLVAAGFLIEAARGIVSEIGFDSFTVPEIQQQVFAYRTESELAESLLLLAPVVLLWGRVHLLPSNLSGRRFALTGAWKRAWLTVAFAGFSIFSFFAIADLKLGLLGVPYLAGVVGFLSFGVGTVGVVGWRIERGFGRSLVQGIVLVSTPFLIAFELAIWYAFPIQMTWYATYFTEPLDFYGVYLVSNWFVLVTSIVLFSLGTTEFMARRLTGTKS